MGPQLVGVRICCPAGGTSSYKSKFARTIAPTPLKWSLGGRPYHVPACQIVFSYNGARPTETPEEEYVDMAVADLDLTGPPSGNRVLRVPNPRKVVQEGLARNQTRKMDPGRSLTASPSTSRALKIENALTSSELKRKTRELAESKKELSLKDAEIMELKNQMGTRDQQLRYSKLELMESRKLVQQKDEQLTQAYESLVAYARERSDLREKLICVEQELMDARDELHHWTTKLVDLKSVIECVDDEDEDLADDFLLQPDPVVSKGGFLDSLLGTPATEASPEEELKEAEKQVASAVDLLKELQDLSEQLLEDAKEDEESLGLKFD